MSAIANRNSASLQPKSSTSDVRNHTSGSQVKSNQKFFPQNKENDVARSSLSNYQLNNLNFNNIIKLRKTSTQSIHSIFSNIFNNKTKNAPQYTYPSSLAKQLFQAVKSGNLKSVEALMKKGADINAVETCEFLPLGTWNYNIPYSSNNASLLYVALITHTNERTNIIKFLIENGAEINETTWCVAVKLKMEHILSKAKKPFLPTLDTMKHAMMITEFDVVAACIEYGINPSQEQIEQSLENEARATNDETSEKNNSDVPRYLYYSQLNGTILKKINIHLVPLKKILQLCKGAICDVNLRRAKEVINRGANVLETLDLGFETRDVELISLLLEKGAKPLVDPNWFDKLTSFPWEQTDKISIAKVLIEKGRANPNPNVSIEKTPLYLAIQIGSPELVMALLNAGAQFQKIPKVMYKFIPECIQESLMNMVLELQPELQQDITNLCDKVMKALDKETLDKVIFAQKKKKLNNAMKSLLSCSKEVAFGCPLHLGLEDQSNPKQKTLVSGLSETIQELLSQKKHYDPAKGLFDMHAIEKGLQDTLKQWSTSYKYQQKEKKQTVDLQKQNQFQVLQSL